VCVSVYKCVCKCVDMGGELELDQNLKLDLSRDWRRRRGDEGASGGWVCGAKGT